MLLRVIIVVVLSVFAVGCHNDFNVRGTHYKVSELSPAPALAMLGLELRDIGFSTPVHTTDDEVETGNIGQNTIKAIRSDEFDLSYYLLGHGQRFKTDGNGDFVELLKIIEVIKTGDSSKLTKIENNLLGFTFPNSSAKQIELFVDPDKRYVMAIYDNNFARPIVAYGSNVDKSMIILTVVNSARR